MARQTLENGVTFGEQRNKINENFEELFEKSAGKDSPYDIVIRTQADFVKLYSSANWLGAASVAFVGDGGTLKFTRTTTGLKIPPTVKRIDGFNNAIIEITGLVYNATSNKGAIWCNAIPTDPTFSISNLHVNATGSSGLAAFANCANLTNCKGVAARSGNSATVKGFSDCANLVNCSAEVDFAYSSGSAYGYGFMGCTNLVNCVSRAVGYGAQSGYGYAYYQCTQLSNCKGTGTGLDAGVESGQGITFYSCSYLNGCKEGTPISTKGIWGGTWLFRDDQSCQLTR